MQDGIGAVLRFGFADEAGEAGGVAQHRRDLFFGIALRVLDGGLHQHYWAGVLMDVVGDDVVEYFAVAHAGRLHYGYLFEVRITYGVHHSLLVRECVPAAAFGAAFGAQVGVGVGPLAKGEAFWGREGLVGGTFQASEVSKRHGGGLLHGGCDVF